MTRLIRAGGLFVALALSAAGLSACGLSTSTSSSTASATTSATTISNATLQVLIANAKTIETQMAAAVPGILSAEGLSAADVANVKTAFAALQAATNQMQTANSLDTATAISLVKATETALNTIVSVAAGLAIIPEPYHTGLVVAALALPAMETGLDIAVQDGTALAATIKAGNVAAATTTTTN